MEFIHNHAAHKPELSRLPPLSAVSTHPLTIVRAARLAGACAFRSGRRTADTRPRYAQTSVAATVMSSV